MKIKNTDVTGMMFKTIFTAYQNPGTQFKSSSYKEKELNNLDGKIY